MTPIFSIVLISASILSILLALIVVRRLRRESRLQKLLVGFYGVTTQFRFFISKLAILGNRVIGIDEVKNKVLFFSKTRNKSDGYLIDLGDVKSISVKREYLMGRSKDKYSANMQPVVDKVVLRLDYKTGARSLVLPFYEKQLDKVSQLSQRSGQAIEWQLLINDRLKKDEHIAARAITDINSYTVLN